MMHEGKGIGRILNDCLQDGKGIVAKLRTAAFHGVEIIEFQDPGENCPRFAGLDRGDRRDIGAGLVGVGATSTCVNLAGATIFIRTPSSIRSDLSMKPFRRRRAPGP